MSFWSVFSFDNFSFSKKEIKLQETEQAREKEIKESKGTQEEVSTKTSKGGK